MKTYQNYTTEDFLNDNDFREWVSSKYITHNETFETIVSNELDYAIGILNSLEGSKVSYTDESKKYLFDKISIAIEGNKVALPITAKNKKIPVVIKYLLPITIAASYFVIFFFNNSSNKSPEKTIAVEQGSELIENLPDGSVVNIDGGSELVIGKNFKKKRTLNLNGRAFFEVKKGSKFSVITNNGTIEVLGTSFSVLSRDNIFEVICKTGKVQVTAVNDTQPQTLLPNEKVSINTNKLIKSKAANEELEWQKGIYYFTDAALLDVLKELENQFNIKVKTDSKNLNLKYTGFFNTSDLEKALYSITWPLNLKFERLPNNEIEIK